MNTATSDGTIVSSNVYGDPISYPFTGNNGLYFRQGQAVQFNPSSTATPIALISWSIDPGASITFVVQDNGLLGDNFAMSWAMTCANGVIQGQVNGLGRVSGVPAVPEPSTWAMMLAGFAGLGFVGYRRGRHEARSFYLFRAPEIDVSS